MTLFSSFVPILVGALCSIWNIWHEKRLIKRPYKSYGLLLACLTVPWAIVWYSILSCRESSPVVLMRAQISFIERQFGHCQTGHQLPQSALPSLRTLLRMHCVNVSFCHGNISGVSSSEDMSTAAYSSDGFCTQGVQAPNARPVHDEHSVES